MGNENIYHGYMDNSLVVIRALQLGIEINMNGHTYVWLDYHPTHEIDGRQYGIHGLSMKGVKIHIQDDGQKSVDTTYMGSNMSLTAFATLCSTLDKNAISSLNLQIAYIERKLGRNKDDVNG